MPATTQRRPAVQPRATGRSVVRPRPVASGRLPGWGDLGGEPLARKVGRTEAWLGRISMGKFVLLVVLGATSFTLYVGHVYRTQEILSELQTVRRDNLRLHLKYNRVKAAFDAATAPGVVIGKARALGLEEGIAYGSAIIEN